MTDSKRGKWVRIKEKEDRGGTKDATPLLSLILQVQLSIIPQNHRTDGRSDFSAEMEDRFVMT